MSRLASLAQLLSTQKENPYKVKAYQRAASQIRKLSESIDELVRDEADLTEFAGIGEGISSAIREIESPGQRMAQHVWQGLTPSVAMQLYQADDLRVAIEEFLIAKYGVRRAEVTGDYRRRVEIIKELTFIIESNDFPAAIGKLESYGGRTQLVSSSAARERGYEFNGISDHSQRQQTEPILRAMDNLYFNILGHATGRLLLKRPGYAIDIERIIEHAHQNQCFFDINSNPGPA